MQLSQPYVEYLFYDLFWYFFNLHFIHVHSFLRNVFNQVFGNSPDKFKSYMLSAFEGLFKSLVTGLKSCRWSLWLWTVSFSFVSFSSPIKWYSRTWHYLRLHLTILIYASKFLSLSYYLFLIDKQKWYIWCMPGYFEIFIHCRIAKSS